jgi:flagellin-like protein
MKRIWNIKKKSGVSPVIATILMVAITVVLAAVLYVMVMNMSGNQGTSTPQGSFASAQRVSGTNVTLTFSSFSKTVGMSQLKLVIESSGTQVAVATWAASSTGSLATLSSTATISIAGYYDVANNNQINIGDTVSLTFASAGSGSTPYKVSMIYVPTGDVVNYIDFSN